MKKTTRERSLLQANRGSWLQNFLDSAQNVLAEQLLKGLQENNVNDMSSSDGKHANDQGALQTVGSQPEKLYPDLEDRNDELSLMSSAYHNEGDDEQRTGKNNNKTEENCGSREGNHRPEGTNHPVFDFGRLGAGLLEVLAKKQYQPENTRGQEGVEISGFDVENIGSELWGLAEQVLNPNGREGQQRTIERQPKEQGDNESGIGYGKVGSELLSSLAEQIMRHSNANTTEPQRQELPINQDSNQSNFDYDKIGSELLGSLVERVRISSDKKENSSESSPTQLGKDDIAAILGSLAENVLKEVKRTKEQKKLSSSTQQPTIADSAGIVASSVLESFAESVLQKYSDKELPQNSSQDPTGPQYYPSGSEGSGSRIQGYEPGPRGYWPNAQRSDFAQPDSGDNKPSQITPSFSLMSSDGHGQNQIIREDPDGKEQSERNN